jgi:hypothetical protein
MNQKLRSFRLKRRMLQLGAIFGMLCPSAAMAQLPPHAPGTICATPIGWCWLPQQIYVNSPCFCPGPYNQPVRGVAV